MTLLFLFLLPIFFHCILSSRIIPFSAQSITMSTTNANDVAEYNFTMMTETPIPPNGIIDIEFPAGQFQTGLGLPNNIIVYAPYPNIVSASVSDRTVTCYVGAKPALKSFTVTIENIINPMKVGGTGSFKIQSRINDYVIDENLIFGVVGISSSSASFINASIAIESGQSSNAGDLSNYIVSFVPSDDIPSNIIIRISFPEIYNLNYVLYDQCQAITYDNYKLSGALQCEVNKNFQNVLDILGSSSIISKGQNIKIKLSKFYNPSISMTTDLFTFRILDKGSNNTLQIQDSVSGMIILPGVMSNVGLTGYYINYLPFAGYTRIFQLSFKPKNPFNSIRISTSFSLINSCYVNKGILDLTLTSNIACKPEANIILITNFQQYVRSDFSNDYVQITFEAVLPLTLFKTKPIEIFTYWDLAYLSMVDQDIGSDSTTITVIASPTVQTSSIILNPANVFPNTAIVIQLSIRTVANMPNVVNIEIPSDYTGTPYCQYKDGGGVSFSDVTCSLSNGLLIAYLTLFNINGPISCTTVTCPTLLISGLQNPAYAGTYKLQSLVYGNGASFVTSIASSTLTVAQNYLTPSSITVTPLVRLYNSPTLIIFDFMINEDLPVGLKNMNDPYVPYSYIDLIFQLKTGGGSALFLSDLGLNAYGITDGMDINCEYILGLQAYTGASLHCVLIEGPTSPIFTDYARVRISNYASVFAGISGKRVVVNVPILNPQFSGSAGSVNIELYRVDSKIVKLIKTCSSFIALTPTTSLNAAGTSMSVSASLLSTEIQANTTLEYQFTRINGDIADSSNNSLIIFFPAGFIFDIKTMIFTLDTTTTISRSSLHLINLFNMLVINLPIILTGPAFDHKIIMKYIQNPISVTTGSFQLYTILNNNYYETSNFVVPTLQPGTFKSINFAIDQLQTLFPYATHTVKFVTSKYIPAFSKIKVTYGASAFNFALAYCTDLSSNLEDLSSTNLLTCTITDPEVVITNFKPLPSNTNISFIISSIINPFLDGPQTIIVSIVDINSLIIESSTFTPSFTIPAFSPYSFTATVQPFPNNAKVYSKYTFNFKPVFVIPAKANITILFPSTYGLLYDSSADKIQCLSSGGLLYLKGCVNEFLEPFQSIQIFTLKQSIPNVMIKLEYFGLVAYPTEENYLNGFQINIYYDTILIATTNSIATFITKNINEISKVSLDYYPKNEGEKAHYIFSFKLSQSYIYSGQKFLIRFPIDYDPFFGPEDLVISSTVLIGALKYQISHRDLLISGFYTLYVKPLTISIDVWGVTNPNRVNNDQTSYFGIGLLNNNSNGNNNQSLIEGTFTIQGIIPLLAPGLIQLISLSSSTTYARYSTDYNFVFLPKQNILDYELGGIIFIDFPENNFIIDTYQGKCTVDQTFSFFSNCYKQNSRFFVNVTNNLWDPLTQGQLNFTINSIVSPDTGGDSLNFVISNYDNLTQTVLGRTYSTLNLAYLTYSYDGLQIYINEDYPIDLEVGSYSNWYKIKLNSSATQSLTLSPNMIDSSIIMDPFPLIIELGQTEISFRLAAPRTILLYSYYITWSKTGDSYPATYAPLRRTKINMRLGSLLQIVFVEYLYYIPQNGTTYPLLIFTNNPPYQELIANITFSNNATSGRFYNGTTELDSSAFLSKSQFLFASRQDSINYTIDVSNDFTGEILPIYYTLSGYDMDSYVLNVSFINVDIIARQTDIPNITFAEVVQVNRSQSKFFVSSDSLGFLFYVYADMHMPDPLFENVRYSTFNTSLNYSNNLYGVTYIKTIPTEKEFTISGLTPGHDYEIFIFIMNMNKLFNSNFTKLYFKTNEMQKTAIMTLKIGLSSITSELTTLYITKLAQMISVTSDRIVSYNINCTVNNFYFTASNTTYLNLLLLPDPISENNKNSPLNLVEKLNSRRSEIQVFITRLDSDSFTTMIELPDLIPSFYTIPTYLDVGIEWFYFKFSVTQCGTLYVIAIPKYGTVNDTESKTTNFSYESNGTNQTFASSYQIINGLNQSNLPALSYSLYVNTPSSDLTVNMTGFPFDKLIYEVYFTTQNSFSYFPKIADNLSVAVIEMKTLKRRKALDIYSINGGYLIKFGILMLISLIMIIIF